MKAKTNKPATVKPAVSAAPGTDTIGLHTMVNAINGGPAIWNMEKNGKKYRDVLRMCRGMDTGFAERHPHGAPWTFTTKTDRALADDIIRAVVAENGSIRGGKRVAMKHFNVTPAVKTTPAVK